MYNLSSFIDSFHSLYEGVTFGEKQIDDILSRSNDFNIGIEYEVRFDKDISTNDVIDMLNEQGIEYDSIVTEHDDMMEIITSKLSLSEGINHIKSMFKFIKEKEIEVPEMAGLHISISTNKYDLEDFNHVKFLILLDSDYIHSVFPEREHVKNYNTLIEIMLGNLPSSLLRSESDVKNIEWRIMTELDKAKYVTSAIKDYFESDGRIELRFFGGENYNEMYDDIKQQLLRSLLLMEVAYTNLYDKVYYKKLSSYLKQDSSLVKVKTEAFKIIRNGSPKDAFKVIADNEKEFLNNSALSKIKEKLENVIAKDAKRSVSYAKNILNDAFPKAEKQIATDATASLIYAIHIRERFELGEKVIAQDSAASLQYARMVIRGPFPEGEDAISTSPSRSYVYARSVLEGPFPKGEDAIATEADLSINYAMWVLNDRFPKGEKIMKAGKPERWESYKSIYIDGEF